MAASASTSPLGSLVEAALRGSPNAPPTIITTTTTTSSPDAAATLALAAHVREHTALLRLVEALGSALTSLDEELRRRGTKVLGDVVAQLAATASLPAEHLQVAVAFFADRLGDYLTIGPVIEALSALATLPTLPDGAALRIATTLLEECDVRSLMQAQRHAAMTLLIDLVGAHWERGGLAPAGARLLLSTVRALDGEKDPRNLLLYLRLLRHLCTRCAGGGVVADGAADTTAVSAAPPPAAADAVPGYVEALPEVFETLIAYFPITFTPPPHDPHQITSQHLLQALLRTLRASWHFAPHALAFFAGKMREAEAGDGDDDDDERDALRMQVLQSISILAPAYGAALVEPHAERIGEGVAGLLGVLDAEAGDGASGGACSSGHQGREGGVAGANASCSGDAAIDTSSGGGGLRAAIGATLSALAQLAAGSREGATPGGAGTLFQRLTAPSIARIVTAPPAGPGAAVGGALLATVYDAAPQARGAVLDQALPPLLRRLSLQEASSGNGGRADALALLLTVLRVATTKLAVTPAEHDADVRRALESHRAQILHAAVSCMREDLAHDAAARAAAAAADFRATAGHLICLCLADGALADDVAVSLKALCEGLLSKREREAEALFAVAARANELRWQERFPAETFDAIVAAPLLAAFVDEARTPSERAARLVPIVAELSRGRAADSPPGEGLRLLLDAGEREAARDAAVGEGSKALLLACFRALARLLDPAAAGDAMLPIWVPPFAAKLLDLVRSKAAAAPAVSATPPAAASGMDAEALVALTAPFWAAVAARAWQAADGTESWFLLQCLPWMLPALASGPATMATSPVPPTDSFGSRDWLDALLLVALVNTPRSVVLPAGTLATLLTRCSVALDSAGAGKDGAPVGSGAPVGLRCVCVAYNKWATPAELDEAMARAHASAMQIHCLAARPREHRAPRRAEAVSGRVACRALRRPPHHAAAPPRDPVAVGAACVAPRGGRWHQVADAADGSRLAPRERGAARAAPRSETPLSALAAAAQCTRSVVGGPAAAAPPPPPAGWRGRRPSERAVAWVRIGGARHQPRRRTDEGAHLGARQRGPLLASVARARRAETGPPGGRLGARRRRAALRRASAGAPPHPRPSRERRGAARRRDTDAARAPRSQRDR